MFDFFKKKTAEKPMDVKSLRHHLLQFIKEQLQKVEGGEAAQIQSIQLFVDPPEAERHLYEAALHIAEEGRFQKNEVQKIADDYALQLPPQWAFSIHFSPVPESAARSRDLPAGIRFQRVSGPEIPAAGNGYLKVLQGTAEQSAYVLPPGTETIAIGRGKKVATSDGFFRINTIAFTEDTGNQFISRQHAHISWDRQRACFLLFADEGGIPPRNKIKIKTAGGNIVKLQTTQVPHILQEGDQIVLGEHALLAFSHQPEPIYHG